MNLHNFNVAFFFYEFLTLYLDFTQDIYILVSHEKKIVTRVLDYLELRTNLEVG